MATGLSSAVQSQSFPYHVVAFCTEYFAERALGRWDFLTTSNGSLAPHSRQAKYQASSTRFPNDKLALMVDDEPSDKPLQ